MFFSIIVLYEIFGLPTAKSGKFTDLKFIFVINPYCFLATNKRNKPMSCQSQKSGKRVEKKDQIKLQSSIKSGMVITLKIVVRMVVLTAVALSPSNISANVSVSDAEGMAITM